MEASFRTFLETLQNDMIHKLETYESKPFMRDVWKRPAGGGGITGVLQSGQIFDSAGVNYSYVHGDALPGSATAHRPELAGRSFKAMGVSSVIHPKNPFVPTAHMNVRLFMAEKEGEAPIAWFGGGYDLTPYYYDSNDCLSWHQVTKTLCDGFDPHVYPKYQKWADDYFFLKHRDEPRGIGGLFFDDLTPEVFGWDWEKCEAFVQSVGRGFLEAYLPLVNQYKDKDFEQKHVEFQHLRRGRYVEFNLLWDRGTLFGIQSGGRTESILMSLPPNVSFKYGQCEAHSAQNEQLVAALKEKSWLTYL